MHVPIVNLTRLTYTKPETPDHDDVLINTSLNRRSVNALASFFGTTFIFYKGGYHAI